MPLPWLSWDPPTSGSNSSWIVGVSGTLAGVAGVEPGDFDCEGDGLVTFAAAGADCLTGRRSFLAVAMTFCASASIVLSFSRNLL